MPHVAYMCFLETLTLDKAFSTNHGIELSQLRENDRVNCDSCNGCPTSSGLQIPFNFFHASSSSTASPIACSEWLHIPVRRWQWDIKLLCVKHDASPHSRWKFI